MSATSKPNVLIYAEPQVSAQISEAIAMPHNMVPAPAGPLAPEFIRDNGPFHAIIADAAAAAVTMSLIQKTLRVCGLSIPTILHRNGRVLNRDVLIAAIRQANLNAHGHTSTGGSRPATSSDADQHRQQHTVLAVDDDPFVLKLMAEVLERDGYNVLTAANGVEALDLVRHRGASIVVTDVKMPEMGGMELCRAIRSDETFGVVYFIMVTAHSDKDVLRMAFETGADDFVPKPFDKQELILRVRAGIRTVNLERDLFRRKIELQKCNAEMAVLNTRLERLATTDELTGLLNRRQALVKTREFVDLAARYKVPLSCLVCDLDHFKQINDTHGHAAGDLTLARTAQAITHAIRSTDVAARIGGEEFLVVCPNTDIEAARALAERIRVAVEQLAQNDPQHGAWATVSIGVAQNGPHGQDPDVMIKHADEALYAAKAAGRNCVCSAEPVLTTAVTADAGGN